MLCVHSFLREKRSSHQLELTDPPLDVVHLMLWLLLVLRRGLVPRSALRWKLHERDLHCVCQWWPHRRLPFEMTEHLHLVARPVVGVCLLGLLLCETVLAHLVSRVAHTYEQLEAWQQPVLVEVQRLVHVIILVLFRFRALSVVVECPLPAHVPSEYPSAEGTEALIKAPVPLWYRVSGAKKNEPIRKAV